MSADPIARLPTAFGKLLARFRIERKLTEETLARGAGLSDTNRVTEFERGDREPTLTEFFRIASALGDPPAILLIDLLAQCQDIGFDPLYKSRPSDFLRLYRLGYFHNPGDFRERPQAYGSMDKATSAARVLNVTRDRKGQPLLDTVLIYVRLGSVAFRPDEEGQS